MCSGAVGKRVLLNYNVLTWFFFINFFFFIRSLNKIEFIIQINRSFYLDPNSNPSKNRVFGQFDHGEHEFQLGFGGMGNTFENTDFTIIADFTVILLHGEPWIIIVKLN